MALYRTSRFDTALRSGIGQLCVKVCSDHRTSQKFELYVTGPYDLILELSVVLCYLIGVRLDVLRSPHSIARVTFSTPQFDDHVPQGASTLANHFSMVTKECYRQLSLCHSGVWRANLVVDHCCPWPRYCKRHQLWVTFAQTCVSTCEVAHLPRLCSQCEATSKGCSFAALPALLRVGLTAERSREIGRAQGLK